MAISLLVVSIPCSTKLCQQCFHYLKKKKNTGCTRVNHFSTQKTVTLWLLKGLLFLSMKFFQSRRVSWWQSPTPAHSSPPLFPPSPCPGLLTGLLFLSVKFFQSSRVSWWQKPMLSRLSWARSRWNMTCQYSKLYLYIEIDKQKLTLRFCWKCDTVQALQLRDLQLRKNETSILTVNV